MTKMRALIDEEGEPVMETCDFKAAFFGGMQMNA